MGFLRRSGQPSQLADSDPAPDGLSMQVDATFFVGAPAKTTGVGALIARRAPGTVITGEVVGEGMTKPGDIVICGEHRFPIKRLEAFKEILVKVEAPRNVGLVLGADVDKDLFSKGQQLRLRR